MTTRFHIPQSIQDNLLFKGKKLGDLTGDEVTSVYDNFERLRGKTEKPKITVAIAAYNEEENLFATLRSLSLQQTNHTVEMIVVNNNSSDRTAELAKKCGVTVHLEMKQGVAHARQNALENASGEIYVSCDADTIYPPKWLDTLVAPLTQKESISVTYSLHCLYDETQQYKLSHYTYQYAKLGYTMLKAHKRGQLNCGGASMAFRTKQALEIGGYNTALLRGEDGFLALELRKFGDIKLVSNKNAFIYTSNRRMLADGSTAKAFAIRAKHGLRHFFSFFSSQKLPLL